MVSWLVPAQPGIAMMILGFLACVCPRRWWAVKRFQPLHASGSDPASKKDRLHVPHVSGRVVLCSDTGVLHWHPMHVWHRTS